MPYALFVGGRGKRSLPPVPVSYKYWLLGVRYVIMKSPKKVKVV